jgi:phosphoserine phosphatase RsbX
VASRPLPGQATSGDAHLVCPFEGGVLVAAIDGLGHGEEAALAARRASEALAARPDGPVIAMLQRCHEACRDSRGVALSLASFNAGLSTMTWLGVGNVEGLLVRADQTLEPSRESLLLRGGVVGERLPPLMAGIVKIGRGDTLVFATDGVHPAFLTELPPATEDPKDVAERILERHAGRSDDALVLVARYRRGEGD